MEMGGGGHDAQFQRIWELAAGSRQGWDMMGVEPTEHLIDVSDRDLTTGVGPTAIIPNSLNCPHGSLWPHDTRERTEQVQMFFTQN